MGEGKQKMSGGGGRSAKGRFFRFSRVSVKFPGMTVVTAASLKGESKHSHPALKSPWAPLLTWTISLNSQDTVCLGRCSHFADGETKAPGGPMTLPRFHCER